jgi:hypothetical protein
MADKLMTRGGIHASELASRARWVDLAIFIAADDSVAHDVQQRGVLQLFDALFGGLAFVQQLRSRNPLLHFAGFQLRIVQSLQALGAECPGGRNASGFGTRSRAHRDDCRCRGRAGGNARQIAARRDVADSEMLDKKCAAGIGKRSERHQIEHAVGRDTQARDLFSPRQFGDHGV